MGMLDEVIGAALGSKPPRAQSQADQGGPSQDPLAQIAAALQVLLAPKEGAAPAEVGAVRAPAGPQSSPGGLDALINQFRKSGLGDAVNSWIGRGQNQAISPSQLRQAIGQETVNDLSRQTGAPQDDLLTQLSKYLPLVVDKLTPNGQLPDQADLRSRYRN